MAKIRSSRIKSSAFKISSYAGPSASQMTLLNQRCGFFCPTDLKSSSSDNYHLLNQRPNYCYDSFWLGSLYNHALSVVRHPLVSLPSVIVICAYLTQGSHSSWKTWKNGDSFSSLEKSWNFLIFAKYPGKMRLTLEI